MQLTKNYKLHQYTDANDRFNKEDFNSTFKKIDDAVGDLQETFNITTKESFVTKQNIDEMKALNTTVKENIDNLIMLDGVNADSKLNLTNLNSENTDAKTTKTNLASENTNSKLTLNGLTLLNTDAKATLNSLNNSNITAKEILDELSKWSVTNENIISMSDKIESNTTKIGILFEDIIERARQTDPARLTTSKTVTGAINELFTNASSGKTLVANAVTNKGVVASADDTFTLLADKIGQISSGKRFAKSTKGYNIPSSDISFSVTDLGFQPKYVIINVWGLDSESYVYLPGTDSYHIYIHPSIGILHNTSLKSYKAHDITVNPNGFTTALYTNGYGTSTNLSWIAIE